MHELERDLAESVRATGPATERTPAPEHYRGAIEPWDYMAAHSLDYWEGNVVKYVTRARRKESALADYRKARDYLDYLIKREQE